MRWGDDDGDVAILSRPTADCSLCQEERCAVRGVDRVGGGGGDWSGASEVWRASSLKVLKFGGG